MVAHLEHIDVDIGPAPSLDEQRLSFKAEVAGQQDAHSLVGDQHDDAGLVRIAGRGDRHHPEVLGHADVEVVAGIQMLVGVHRTAFFLDDIEQRIEHHAALQARVINAAHVVGLQHLVGAAIVVGVRVADHQGVDSVNALRIELLQQVAGAR